MRVSVAAKGTWAAERKAIKKYPNYNVSKVRCIRGYRSGQDGFYEVTLNKRFMKNPKSRSRR